MCLFHNRTASLDLQIKRRLTSEGRMVRVKSFKLLTSSLSDETPLDSFTPSFFFSFSFAFCFENKTQAEYCGGY